VTAARRPPGRHIPAGTRGWRRRRRGEPLRGGIRVRGPGPDRGPGWAGLRPDERGCRARQTGWHGHACGRDTGTGVPRQHRRRRSGKASCGVVVQTAGQDVMELIRWISTGLRGPCEVWAGRWMTSWHGGRDLLADLADGNVPKRLPAQDVRATLSRWSRSTSLFRSN